MRSASSNCDDAYPVRTDKEPVFDDVYDDEQSVVYLV